MKTLFKQVVEVGRFWFQIWKKNEIWKWNWKNQKKSFQHFTYTDCI